MNCPTDGTTPSFQLLLSGERMLVLFGVPYFFHFGTHFFMFQIYLYFILFVSINQGTFSGSVQATDRLMKELRNVYKSESFRIGESQAH